MAGTSGIASLSECSSLYNKKKKLRNQFSDLSSEGWFPHKFPAHLN